jgi:hypothetical protein
MLVLLWDRDSGALTIDKSQSDKGWEIVHDGNAKFTFATIIHHAEGHSELAFMSGMFDHGNSWRAIAMVEGWDEPLVLEGEVECSDEGVNFLGLNDKIMEAFY